MFKHYLGTFAILALFMAALSCSAAKVTRAELEALKPGDVVVFRYDKDGKTWRYGEQITRIEGDKIYYYPSTHESGDGKTAKITTDFNKSAELSRTKEEYYKFEANQGPEKRAIMWIE